MKTADIEVTLIDFMGYDLSVVNAARVSFDKESKWIDTEVVCHSEEGGWIQEPAFKLSERDEKLISYLAKHKHTSPFNHCFATFRVKAPIFVARQLVKHKFMPWNEVSRRYVDSEPEFYIPEVWRKKADNVKQGSSDEAAGISNEWVEGQIRTMLTVYQLMLENDVCPEQARMVLPQNTMTEWIWSGSLGAFASMCKLRLDDHSQKETRLVAEKVSSEMQSLYPVSWAALMEE